MRLLRRTSAKALLFLIILFELSAFTLLAFRNAGTLDIQALIVGGAMVALLLFQYLALRAFFKHVDRYLLIVANVLITIGMIVQYRLDPETAIRQLIWIGVGMLFMIVAIVVVRHIKTLLRFNWLYMIFSIGLLALPIFFGRTTGGARNWLPIGPFAFQPSEFIKVAVIFLMAKWMYEKRRTVQLLPLGLFVGLCIALLVVQRDLGAALLYAGTALILYYVGTGNWIVTLGTLGLVSAGAVASYHMFSHVRVRVEIWKNPWATYSTDGYQVAQGLMAIASGGLFGLGLTRGAPKSIPAYWTDYIFAVICEEFGILVGLAVVAFYLVIILRGALIALGARDKFRALLAIGCTTLLTLQSFIIIGGVIKLIPLTGITMPFVSYGGSSMIVSMILLGVLEGVAIDNGDWLESAVDEKKR